MRRRRAASNSPASLLRRFGSSTVARFVLIGSFVVRLAKRISNPLATPPAYSAEAATLTSVEG
jgi:hypothetical protein